MWFADQHSAGASVGDAHAAVKDRPARPSTPTHRSSRPSGPSTSGTGAERSLSEGRSDMISPEAYAALPPSIQKKYFSSAERLRISQQAAALKRRKQRRKQTWLSSTSSAGPLTRSQSADELRSASYRSMRQGCVNRQISGMDARTKDEAKWILSLPDKAQTQYFSREELAQLTQDSQGSGQQPSDAPADRGGTTHGLASASSSQSRAGEERSVASALDTHPEPDPDTGANGHVAPPRGSSQTQEDAGPKPEVSNRSSHRRTSTAHTVSCSSPPPEQKVKLKPFSRTLALTPIALPPPTLAPASPAPSPAPARNGATSARLSRPFMGHTLLLEEHPPDELGHQAPQKLRTNMSSPSTVDEMLQFDSPFSGRLPSSASTDSSFALQGPASLSSYDPGDDMSLSVHGPPTRMFPRPDRQSGQSASVDSGIGIPMPLNGAEKSDNGHSRASSKASHRDMTTRVPTELQMAEDKLYSFQRTQTSGVPVDNDPLALVPLAVCDDPTGAHGAFAKKYDTPQRKGLKKMWSSMRRR